MNGEIILTGLALCVLSFIAGEMFGFKRGYEEAEKYLDKKIAELRRELKLDPAQ